MHQCTGVDRINFQTARVHWWEPVLLSMLVERVRNCGRTALCIKRTYSVSLIFSIRTRRRFIYLFVCSLGIRVLHCSLVQLPVIHTESGGTIFLLDQHYRWSPWTGGWLNDSTCQHLLYLSIGFGSLMDGQAWGRLTDGTSAPNVNRVLYNSGSPVVVWCRGEDIRKLVSRAATAGFFSVVRSCLLFLRR